MSSIPAEQRRLAAIMFTDMVGYSALSQRSEPLALELLEEHRAVLRAAFARHGGREIEAIGDGFFAEFASALDGVRCAVDIQESLANRNAAVIAERRIQVRIGLHLGDVVQRGQHVHGDGVNIAARIEPLAPPGGVCLSEDVARQIENKIGLPLRKLGKGDLKNIRLPVDIYRLVLSGERRHLPFWEYVAFSARQRRTRLAAAVLIAVAVIGGLVGAYLWPRAHDRATVDAVLALPKGPSVAVLPFSNLSGDPAKDYFVDGFTEEIVTDLTRFRDLQVRSLASTFQYKGKAVDVREAGRDLGVLFIVLGSVRAIENDVRVTAQLVSTKDGRQVWADAYDRKVAPSQILAMQADISEKVVSAIGSVYGGAISLAVWVETKKKLPEQMESYDCALRARDYIRVLTADQHAAARDCLEKTVANDPHYPLAWTLLSLVYQNEYFFEHNPKPDSINRAVQAARRGMEGDPNVATVALARALYAKQDPAFFDYAERAIAMNPLDADTLAQLGMNMAWAGHWERGIEFARKALALDPNLPWWAYIPLQTYHYRKREYDRALEYARKIDVQYFWSWVHLAIDYAQLGRTAEARSAAAEILRLYPTFPQNARREIHKWIWEKEFADHMIDGLRKAGLDIPSEEAVVR